jgi:predicted CXXCH cytochrome family protein
MLDETGQLQCTSCHDQHDESKPKYLVNDTLLLCFTCHDFTANTQGRHHIPDRDHPWDTFRCTVCHGTLLDGTPGEGGDGIATACKSCHNPFTAPDTPPPGHHGGDRFLPYINCVACHADPVSGILTGNYFGNLFAPSCYKCHADLWNIANNSPSPPTMPDLEGTVGVSVEFDASHITDPENDPLAFQWGFGDGSQPEFPSHSPTTNHTYHDYGTYTATLAVTDGVNELQFVQFVVTILPPIEEPTVDAWEVSTTTDPPETFTITIEEHSGSLVVLRDNGAAPSSLGFGIEFTGIIFWMELWMDLSGNVLWGTGDVYFGNISRTAGTMTGVVFDDSGGVATFSGTK